MNAAPALQYEQTAARLAGQPQCSMYRQVVPHIDAKHSYEEPKLSAPAQVRTFEHRSAAVSDRDVAKQVASALVVDFGHYRSTHKAIAQRAGVSPETVKRWVAAESAPSLVYFLRLLPHSPSLRKLVAMESDLSPDFTRELSALIQRHMK